MGEIMGILIFGYEVMKQVLFSQKLKESGYPTDFSNKTDNALEAEI